MSVVFITGMSGAGKSTALKELERRGFETADTDYGRWCHQVDGELVWDEPKIKALLDQERGGVLYLSGTVSNQGRFYDRFDAVVLLTAPHAVLLQRLRTRTTNNYGKTEAERLEVSHYIRTVEPLLRETATHVVHTEQPMSAVADSLVRIGAERVR